MVRHSTAVVLALLLALPPAALPQEAPRGGEDALFETVDVSVVNVEVIVTDGQGRRVTGLTKDDFELYEDGKPVEVSYFFASEGAPGAAGTPGAPAQRPEPERLQLAVYLDVEELPDKARPRIVESIERFVASRAKPGEQVMLASYNGPDTLTVRFVPVERPTLTAALQAVADAPKPAPSGSADQRLLQTKQEMAVQAAPDGGKNSAFAMAQLDQMDIAMTAESNRLKARNLARHSLAALTQFLGGLGSLPGRKALLYVSANATFRPGQTIEQTFDRKYGRGMVVDGPLRKLLNDLEEGAISERILFFAMGARDVLQEVVSGGKADPIATVAGKIDHAQDLIDDVPEAALARVEEDLDSYYSLGFTPAKREPGKRRRLEVKVKRPGLQVRHNEAYRELAPNVRASNRTVAALLLGSAGPTVQGAAVREDENPLGIRLQVGQPEAGKGSKVTVPVTIRFPLSRLTLLPGPGGTQTARLAIYIGARDPQGRTSEIGEVQLPLKLPASVQPGQAGSYTAKLMLRPLPHTIAVGVRDELGGTVSTATVAYAPAP